MDLAGFGTAALKLIAMNENYQIDVTELARQIEADRAAGSLPFLIVGSAGTVDVGAIDDLDALAELARLGKPVAIHAIGGRAIGQALSALEALEGAGLRLPARGRRRPSG